MEMNDIDRMDELKEQFAMLTQKLETQKINNQRLLENVMKHGMGRIKRYIYVDVIFGLPIGILCWGFIYFQGFVSLPMTIFTLVMMVAGGIATCWINKALSRTDWLEGDLLVARSTLLKMKKARTKQLLIEIPVLVVWGICFLIDALLFHDHELSQAIITGFVVGGICGALIGYSFYKKMQRTNDDLIEEIDRFNQMN